MGDGVTVLICTYNGQKSIANTLIHLSNQKVSIDLNWEVLLINNSSTDDTEKIAIKLWLDLKTPIKLTILNEPAPGKDNAVDYGLQRAEYKYVIICDDDNWLCNSYVQTAYDIMSTNPEIGILGGNGIPVFDTEAPNWFYKYKVFYAVGEQNVIEGEIKHYWPKYQFIWGAGSVINMKAYKLLLDSGFERILRFKKYPKVARSEDVELCFALWLTGYKVWYSKELVYQHYIPSERLKWAYLMNVIKQSISSIHYIRPYNILIFTGVVMAPKKSFWRQYIVHNFNLIRKEFKSLADLKILIHIIRDRHIESSEYYQKAVIWYQFYSTFKLGKEYDALYKRVALLQNNLAKKSELNIR